MTVNSDCFNIKERKSVDMDVLNQEPNEFILSLQTVGDILEMRQDW